MSGITPEKLDEWEAEASKPGYPDGKWEGAVVALCVALREAWQETQDVLAREHLHAEREDFEEEEAKP